MTIHFRGGSLLIYGHRPISSGHRLNRSGPSHISCQSHSF